MATGLGGAQGIAWGPAEQSVIVGSTLNNQHLERVTVSSGKRERIELAGSGAVYPATSRAGDELAFVRRSSGIDIWKFEDGGKTGPAPFTSLCSALTDEAPQYSQDGSHIAFDSNRSGQGYQIYVATANGMELKPVTALTDNRQGSPRWSPNGKQIAYDGRRRRSATWHIYVVDADGSRPSTLLTSMPRECSKLVAGRQVDLLQRASF